MLSTLLKSLLQILCVCIPVFIRFRFSIHNSSGMNLNIFSTTQNLNTTHFNLPEDPYTHESTAAQLTMPHPLQAQLYQAAVVVLNILPVIVLIGLVGNTLSLLVMAKPHNRHVSCCVYMGALAVSDNVVLIIAGHYWMRTSGYFGSMGQIECKYLCYFAMGVGPMGVMFILCMTVERVLAVRFPLKSAIWCNYKRARKAVIAIVIIFLIYAIPNILYAQIGFNGKFHDCYVYGVQSTVANIHSYTSTILNSLFPFSIILICNAVIIFTMHRRNKHFNKNNSDTFAKGGSEGRKLKTKNQERQLGRMLMMVSFALLILTLPHYVNITFGVHSNPRLYYGTYALVGSVANRLYFLNNGINFFLYCIGGSKFREDLFAVLCFKRSVNKSSLDLSISVNTMSNDVNMATNIG